MSGFVADVDPADARQTARRILSGRQYRSAPTPRPLRKQLNWLGKLLEKPFKWIGDVLSHVPAILLLVIAFVIAGVAIAFIVSKVRERAGSPDERRRARRIAAAEAEDPDALERAAEAAEQEGRLDDALRLRFRAGLLRLGDRGAIRYRPSVTTNEVRRVLGSETFDELARTFEAVAYGGRDAGAPDLDTARREWPRVVAGATRPRSE
jgi:hypothetical protein